MEVNPASYLEGLLEDQLALCHFGSTRLTNVEGYHFLLCRGWTGLGMVMMIVWGIIELGRNRPNQEMFVSVG